MEIIIVVVIGLVIALALYRYAQTSMRQKRVENKVIMADLITREDIELLRRTKSEYFDQAVHLRRRQVESGRNID